MYILINKISSYHKEIFNHFYNSIYNNIYYSNYLNLKKFSVRRAIYKELRELPLRLPHRGTYTVRRQLTSRAAPFLFQTSSFLTPLNWHRTSHLRNTWTPPNNHEATTLKPPSKYFVRRNTLTSNTSLLSTFLAARHARIAGFSSASGLLSTPIYIRQDARERARMYTRAHVSTSLSATIHPLSAMEKCKCAACVRTRRYFHRCRETKCDRSRKIYNWRREWLVRARTRVGAFIILFAELIHSLSAVTLKCANARLPAHGVSAFASVLILCLRIFSRLIATLE